jgi:hypothetical protein
VSCRRATIAGPIGSAAPALVVALLPKCPACLGASLAIVSSLGLGELAPGVLRAVMFGGLVIALALLGRAARRRDRWVAFAVSCVGATIVAAGSLVDAGRATLVAGVVVLYAGALRIYLAPRKLCP